ncbi:MAG TPA: amidohydrolase family protein [Candidatus Acidoferrales bacterium]|nr:amidohydrolase family protein [Candidatus Acidoferrales bacterium]
MRRIPAGLLAVLGALAVAGGLAAAAGKTTVIKAARMFDGKSGKITSPGVVVVTDGKIAAVGANASVPAGAEVVDLGDATLMPGFIDAHTHLTMSDSYDYRKEFIDDLQEPIAELAIASTVNARKTLLAGFTLVRDVGSEYQLDVGLRNSIRKGTVIGPRMLVSVHAIGATGGHCDDTNGYRQGLFPETTPSQGVVNGPDEARKAVRLMHKYGADVIKTCATGGVLSLSDAVDTPQLTQAELDALVDEAHSLRLKTAAHAHGAEGAKRAIRAGIDSIEHGTFLDDEALDMMKAKGTYLVPTLMAHVGVEERLAADPNVPEAIQIKGRAAIAALHDMMRRAIAKGVKIAFGTDAAVYPHGRNAGEFNQLVQMGMKPEDALRTVAASADLLGWSDRLGTLEAGKLGDVVGVPGNPLEDVRVTEKVVFVMKGGVVYRNDRTSAK